MAHYESHESGMGKGLLIGILAGGAVGAVVGLLFAPKPGRELRNDLSDWSGTAIDKIGDLAGTAKEKTSEIYNEGRARAESLISDVKEKASTLMSDAERIVSDARDRVTGGDDKPSSGKALASKVGDAAKAGVQAARNEMRS